jgi:hypothetical protein
MNNFLDNAFFSDHEGSFFQRRSACFRLFAFARIPCPAMAGLRGASSYNGLKRFSRFFMLTF